MTLRKEIIRTFGIFALIVGIIFGVIYYTVNRVDNRKLTLEQLSEKASVSSQLMHNLVSQMRSATQILISNEDVLSAINLLSKGKNKDSSYESVYFSNAYTTIRVGINTCFNYENFYRMIFFNENGDVVAGRNILDGIVDSSVNYSDIPWLDRVNPIGITVIPCHTDDWGAKKRTVLSIVKKLVGSNMGYIEVQWQKETLDEYFVSEETDYSILFYNTEGELLYSYSEDEDADFFSYVKDADFRDISESVPSRKVMFSSHLDSENEIITVVAAPYDSFGTFLAILPGTLLIILVFLVLGLGYVAISSSGISKPISSLRDIMEHTDIARVTEGNFPEYTISHSTEEIKVLYDSYYEMLRRLSESVKNERQFSDLQLQAQFDLLQAQVNPHFLYNVLNVLASRGMLANDEGICEICSSLGEMLRYSTNAKQKTATVNEEAEYLSSYLKLMKYRYEDSLEYSIDILPEIGSIDIPKVVLEQIVENSFKHRNTKGGSIINIIVTSNADDGKWVINISDNGSGFEKEKLEELNQKFAQVRRQLSTDRKHIEMEIGGMGLVNVYARLYMHFGERLIFSIQTNDNGSTISFGSNPGCKENEI